MAVTAQEVKNLITGCTLDDKIVESVITDATNFVNSSFTDCDDLSNAELDSITKWLSAHLIVSGPHRQALREKLGVAEVEYDAQTGEGLESSTYGRIALSLDRCGALKKANKQAIKISAITSFE